MTPEAEAVAREYMIYRMCEHGWGLFRILDEEGIRHGDVLTERDVVRLLAAHWLGSVKDAPAAPAARPAPVMRAAVPCRSMVRAPVRVPEKPKDVRAFRMLASERIEGSVAA